MPSYIPDNLRLSAREAATIPISLVKRAESFRRDDAATTTDVSMTGMGIKTSMALIPGEWVGVIAKGEFPHAIPAHVVWAREDEATHWTYAGIQFVSGTVV